MQNSSDGRFRLSANARALVGVVRKLGVNVHWHREYSGVWGFYSENSNAVHFASADTLIIAHELAHVVHCRYETVVTEEDVVRSEKIAELTAAVICQLLGEKGYEAESIAFLNNNLNADIIDVLTDSSVTAMVHKIVNDIFVLIRQHKTA